MLDPHRVKDLALFFRRKVQQEFAFFVYVLCVIVGIWAFAELADEVIEGESRAFDQIVLQAVRGVGASGEPRGPLWLTESMLEITALGGLTVLTLVTVVALGLLLLLRKYRSSLLTLAAVGGGIALSSALKLLFARERPDQLLHLTGVQTYSFPSGHSMMSAVVYCSLAVMLAGTLQHTRTRIYIVLVALCLTLAIGVSRIYLGVHYPTDVLAGWSIGLAWAGVWWVVSWMLRRRTAAFSDEEKNA